MFSFKQMIFKKTNDNSVRYTAKSEQTKDGDNKPNTI